MREDCDVDDLVDVIEGSRVYIPAIYAVNKIDQITLVRTTPCLHPPPHGAASLHCLLVSETSPITAAPFRCVHTLTQARIARHAVLLGAQEELSVLDRLPHVCPVCAYHEWNLDGLVEMAWEYLDLIRIYTKPKARALTPPRAQRLRRRQPRNVSLVASGLFIKCIRLIMIVTVTFYKA